jgi:hypothetical protein
MEYHLYPPFFVSEPEPSFNDAWEEFCCELLNLENYTNIIRRRTPPDYGCDLIWEEKKVAYQCKAVENGQSGKLNLVEVRKSIERAITNKDIVGWDKYILCTNVNLTGKQEQKIREMLPDIEFYSLTYWKTLCKKYSSVADSRCRQLITIPRDSVTRAINEVFLQQYAQNLGEQLGTSTYPLLIYSSNRNALFKVPVSLEYSVRDVLKVLIKVFELPDPEEFRDIEIKVSINSFLAINGKLLSPEKKISDLLSQFEERPLVTFVTQIEWREQTRRRTAFVMELKTSFRINSFSLQERLKIANERYEQKINVAFEQAIESFRKKRR